MKSTITCASLFLANSVSLYSQSQFAEGISEISPLTNFTDFLNEPVPQLSGDGRTVLFLRPAPVGSEDQSVVLRRANGDEDLVSALLGSRVSEVTGLSSNGEAFAGNRFGATPDDSDPTAFFYNSSGLIDIPFLPETEEDRGSSVNTALAISGDGTVVVGANDRGTGDFLIEAFRWSQEEGTVGLGTLATQSGPAENRETGALDVNFDGSVIVGLSFDENSDEFRAFRWTEEEGVTELAGYEGLLSSFAFAVSDSGASAVGSHIELQNLGSGDLSGGDRALLWETPTSAAEALWAGYAFDVTDGEAGPIVVGSRIDETREAFDGDIFGVIPEGEAVRWTRARGVETVPEWLARTGAPVGPSAGDFASATSVSSDGRTLLLVSTEDVVLDESGDIESFSSRSAVAREGNGVLTMDENLTASLFTGFSYQSAARQLPNMTLNGAHHRVLMDSPLNEEGWSSWATGDFATHDRLNADQYLGEVGVSSDFGIQNMRFGLGVGAGSVSQDLPFNGDSDIDGQFILGEVNYRFPKESVIFSALAYYGRWDADVERGYLNGGLRDSSRGSTDIDSFALRVRVDWQDALKSGKWSASPRLAYALISTQSDSYTERGGGFPVRFDGQDDFEQEIRLGVDFDYDLSDRTGFRAGFELVKRFEDESRLSGVILGVNDFTFPGTDLRSFWGRANAEVTHLLTNDLLLNLSISGSTAGADPTFGASTGFQYRF